LRFFQRRQAVVADLWSGGGEGSAERTHSGFLNALLAGESAQFEEASFGERVWGAAFSRHVCPLLEDEVEALE